jgi:hypothetical protein
MLNVRPGLWIAVALLALNGCSHGGRATSPQQPAKIPRAPAGPAQPSAPSASGAATPAPLSPRRGALPLAANTVPRLPPDAAPEILDVALSETTVQPGDRVVGNVVTSSNVASVEARIGGYGVSLVKVGVGRFELSYTVGPVPWFVRGNFSMQVIARNPRGDAVTRVVPLTVR